MFSPPRPLNPNFDPIFLPFGVNVCRWLKLAIPEGCCPATFRSLFRVRIVSVFRVSWVSSPTVYRFAQDQRFVFLIASRHQVKLFAIVNLNAPGNSLALERPSLLALLEVKLVRAAFHSRAQQ
jgi:hypothetical protein